ncbi:MAG: RNA degradosome polyphosphate kinase, partial [Pseudomonadota bacterium]
MSSANFLEANYPKPAALDDDRRTGPRRFFNREISWLAFNWRVLEEAGNPRVPLLERLRFLSISAANLDEFTTVRVAGLRELVREGNATPAADGRSPAEQLVMIDADAGRLLRAQQERWKTLREEMEGAGISLMSPDALKVAEKRMLADRFLREVFPVLSPLAIDPAHPFPFIPNEGMALAVELERKTDGRTLRALLPIPAQIDRFLRLEDEGDRIRFLPMESMLLMQIDTMFPGYALKGHCSFRVLRDSDLEVEEEAEDLVREFETALKRRRRGEIVRMTITKGAPEGLKSEIVEEIGVGAHEAIEVDGLIGLAALKELVVDDRKDLLWPGFMPRVPERVQDHD